MDSKLEQALIKTGIGGFRMGTYGKGRGVLLSATQYMDPVEHLDKMNTVAGVLSDPQWGLKLSTRFQSVLMA